MGLQGKGTQGTEGTQGTGNDRVVGGFIPVHGGYENLLSYQKAEIVYDATVRFCARYLSRRDRTYDQMVQAARSGKQNIAEGSQVSGTNKEFEINLTSVARASLEELLVDYRDFLRTHNLDEWTVEHPYSQHLRRLSRQPGNNYATFRRGIEHPDLAISVNVIIGLIKLASFLLDRQLRKLERDYLNNGGLRERIATSRRINRTNPARGGTHPP